MSPLLLRSSENVQGRSVSVTKQQRALIKGQKACCLWLTGLSGAGKSTIADALDRRLFEMGYHTSVLDGDIVRLGLNLDLGFTNDDRAENIRRISEVASLMVQSGMIVIVACISPFRADRQQARQKFLNDEFLEIFVDTPIDICERRDPKGLYRKARANKIPHFTGINSPYEPPEVAELRLITNETSADELVKTIVTELHLRNIFLKLPLSVVPRPIGRQLRRPFKG